MLFHPTSIFVGLDIALCILKISSRTNILFKTVLTTNQLDNVITITMKDPYCIIYSICDTAYEIIRTY